MTTLPMPCVLGRIETEGADMDSREALMTESLMKMAGATFAAGLFFAGCSGEPCGRPKPVAAFDTSFADAEIACGAGAYTKALALSDRAWEEAQGSYPEGDARLAECRRRAARLRTRCGAALVTGGYTAAGLVACQQALALDPEQADAHYQMGVARREMGEDAAALKCWDLAMTHDRRHGLTKFDTAMLLYDIGEVSAAALELHRGVVCLREDNLSPEQGVYARVAERLALRLAREWAKKMPGPDLREE